MKDKRQEAKVKKEDASRAVSRLLFLIFAFCLLPFAFRGAALLRDDRERRDFGALLGGTHGVARRGVHLVGRGEKFLGCRGRRRTSLCARRATRTPTCRAKPPRRRVSPRRNWSSP